MPSAWGRREGTLWTVTRGPVAYHILEDRHPAEEYEWTKANDGQPLEVRLLGFARDEPFRSFEDNEHPSKKLNFETANRRAWSVRDAHREIANQDSRIRIRESEGERVPEDHHPRWSGGPLRQPRHGDSGHVLYAPTFAVLGEHPLYPVQRLNDAHGRPAQ